MIDQCVDITVQIGHHQSCHMSLALTETNKSLCQHSTPTRETGTGVPHTAKTIWTMVCRHTDATIRIKLGKPERSQEEKSILRMASMDTVYRGKPFSCSYWKYQRRFPILCLRIRAYLQNQWLQNRMEKPPPGFTINVTRLEGICLLFCNTEILLQKYWSLDSCGGKDRHRLGYDGTDPTLNTNKWQVIGRIPSHKKWKRGHLIPVASLHHRTVKLIPIFCQSNHWDSSDVMSHIKCDVPSRAM